jgi:hypothetical protein
VVTTNTSDGVLRLAEQDATSHTIEVRLASQPSIDIIVAVTADNRQAEVVDGVRINGASYTLLTFTSDNWGRPQAVTVRAVDDGFAENDPHPSAVTVAVLRGEGRLSVDGQVGSSGRVLPVEIADDDQAGLAVSPTSLALTEGGPAVTVDVGLSGTPKTGAVVNLTASTSGRCTVSPTAFVDIQDRAPRTLTVTPGRDHVPGDRDCTVRIATTSPQRHSPPPLFFPLPRDLDYEGLTVDVGGPVTNVDIPDVTITPSDLVADVHPRQLGRASNRHPHLARRHRTPQCGDPPRGHGRRCRLRRPRARRRQRGHRRPTTTIELTASPDEPITTKPTRATAALSADVGTPTGSVVFSVDGASDCGCDAAIVDGVAEYDLGRLPAGTHTITVSYAGDATHQAATATIELEVTDTITGRANDDILTGGLGADTLNGNGGADNLIGHDGDDHLNGGPDRDTCRGGAHTDQQTGCEFILGVP